MKKIITGLLLAGMMACTVQANAQSTEITQLLLNVEKLVQFKQILSDLKKGYDIVSKGYGTIKDISQGNFNIHKTFLDGLYAVSPEVRKYRKVAEIIDYQLVLVKGYKAAFNRYKANGYFKPDELDYLGKVYNQLFKSSLKNLDELAMILTANQTRMSDDERLKAIDGIHADMEDKVLFLRSFNNENNVLALQREKELNDIRTTQRANELTK